MYFSRMRPTDAFGLVVFDTQAETVIPCTLKKDLVP